MYRAVGKDGKRKRKRKYEDDVIVRSVLIIVLYHFDGKWLTYRGNNTKNITRVYLAITNVSHRIGWMNGLYLRGPKVRTMYKL